MPLDSKEGRLLVARRIKYARMCAKLTQADVAAALGITPQAISNYERGLNGIANSVIYKMAELFGVSADFLLGISDNEMPIPRDIKDLLGDGADALTSHETQAIIELHGIVNEFIRYIGTKYRAALPFASECMEAATLCFAHLCEICNGENLEKMQPGQFAGTALKEIDGLQDAYARFALQLQAAITRTKEASAIRDDEGKPLTDE